MKYGLSFYALYTNDLTKYRRNEKKIAEESNHYINAGWYTYILRGINKEILCTIISKIVKFILRIGKKESARHKYYNIRIKIKPYIPSAIVNSKKKYNNNNKIDASALYNHYTLILQCNENIEIKKNMKNTKQRIVYWVFATMKWFFLLLPKRFCMYLLFYCVLYRAQYCIEDTRTKRMNSRKKNIANTTHKQIHVSTYFSVNVKQKKNKMWQQQFHLQYELFFILLLRSFSVKQNWISK